MDKVSAWAEVEAGEDRQVEAVSVEALAAEEPGIIIQVITTVCTEGVMNVIIKPKMKRILKSEINSCVFRSRLK